MLRFLHLSDIHFHPSPGAPQRDVDRAVRQDLLNDLRALGDSACPIDAILVVGDLAARGKPEEFVLARQFLDEVCAIVECDPRAIACVPGNHDVDRDAQSHLHDGLRSLLRTHPPGAIADRLERILSDDAAATILHAPFEAYNEFARPLGFAVTSEEPVPAPWELPLGDTVVRVRGVNSALICDSSDDAAYDATKVILGAGQLVQVVDDYDAVTVLMCHHPSNWFRDADHVLPWLARPHLLLTGHEHLVGVVPSADGRSLAIASGAVNPERATLDWAPAYNLIELELEDDRLEVSVRVRCYAPGRTGFGPEEGRPDPDKYTLPQDRKATTAPAPPPVLRPAPPVRSDERAKIHRIMSVGPDTREAAARRLGILTCGEHLITEADEARALGLIRERGLVDRMVAEIADD